MLGREGQELSREKKKVSWFQIQSLKQSSNADGVSMSELKELSGHLADFQQFKLASCLRQHIALNVYSDHFLTILLWKVACVYQGVYTISYFTVTKRGLKQKPGGKRDDRRTVRPVR